MISKLGQYVGPLTAWYTFTAFYYLYSLNIFFFNYGCLHSRFPPTLFFCFLLCSLLQLLLAEQPICSRSFLLRERKRLERRSRVGGVVYLYEERKSTQENVWTIVFCMNWYSRLLLIYVKRCGFPRLFMSFVFFLVFVL